jgi:hypothetical protein
MGLPECILCVRSLRHTCESFGLIRNIWFGFVVVARLHSLCSSRNTCEVFGLVRNNLFGFVEVAWLQSRVKDLVWKGIFGLVLWRLPECILCVGPGNSPELQRRLHTLWIVQLNIKKLVRKVLFV